MATWNCRTYTFIIIIAGLLVTLALFKQRFVIKRFYLWFIIALMFAFTMVGSTGVNYGHRTAFVAEIGFITALTNLLYIVLQRLQPLYLFPLPGLLLVLSLWSADFIKTYDQYLATWHQTQRRAEIMETYHSNGIKRIVLPSMAIPYISGLRDDIVERRYFLRDIHPDQKGNGWRNSTYAQYHGFEFSNRIKKPYMIYAPELANNTRFKHIGKIREFDIYVRPEKHGLKHDDVIYFIGEGRTCNIVKKIQVYPVDVDDLNGRDQKQRHTVLTAEKTVAWVSTQVKEPKEKCVVRFSLPEWDVEKVVFSHSSLPWPN